jgi:endonuclease/exonuclease/phosphatase family metal-dependent hydrolase
MLLRRSWSLLWLVCLLGCGGAASSPPGDKYASHPAPIVVDGTGGDWADVPVRHADRGDGDGLALERLWMAHDAHRLYLRVELNRPVSLHEDNTLTLHLDLDNDPSTGTPARGLGAEARWTFGDRTGRVGDVRIRPTALGLHALPTVATDVFEIALDRSARPAGRPLIRGDSLRVALSTAGDRLPDAGGLGYVLTDSTRTAPAPTPRRPPAADVRVLSYNAVNNVEAERNAIFEARRQPHYRRILRAAAPDVVAFQEVYDQTAAEVERVAEGPLGLPDAWHWTKRGADLVVGSRFPIEAARALPGYEDVRSAAVLLDARPALGRRLLVVVLHPPCCNRPADGPTPSRNEQRQRVVDGVAAFLAAVTAGEGPFPVPPGTPIAVVGDMNFVGDPQQPRTLRTGAVVHTDRFGAGGPPDWDGSGLRDVNPRQTGAPLHTTWIDSTSAYPPGRLDYAYVSDSVVDVPHAFVLRTATLSARQRERFGLRAADTGIASDHLPVVIDLAGP